MTILISDCNEYVLITNSEEHTFDVIAADGSRLWLWDRTPYTSNDDPRLRRAQRRFGVIGVSNHSRSTRSGRRIRDFSVAIAELDQGVEIIPGKGNAIITRQEIRFRKTINRLTRRRRNSG